MKTAQRVDRNLVLMTVSVGCEKEENVIQTVSRDALYSSWIMVFLSPEASSRCIKLTQVLKRNDVGEVQYYRETHLTS